MRKKEHMSLCKKEKEKEKERKKETSLGYVTPLIPAMLVGENVTMQAPSGNNNTNNNTNKRNSRTQSQKKSATFNNKQ
jgi:hypothetical protein